MNEQEINIAIAESMGWKSTDGHFSFPWFNEKGKPRQFLHDYTSDLNAMHEVEITLSTRQLQNMAERLLQSVDKPRFHATARQRAEAYLKTLNLYTD